MNYDNFLIPLSGIATPLPHLPNLKKIVLSNGKMYVELLNYGARISGIYIPDKNEGVTNVVLSYTDLADYLNDTYYLGSTIGRYAGRIASGKLQVSDKIYQLPLNDNKKHHLHGGSDAFDKHFFEVTDVVSDNGSSSATLRTCSVHGDQGYPGNLELSVTYRLTDDDALIITYSAKSDQDTHVNFTNHTYFNLTGEPSRALDQRLQITSDEFLESGSDYIPTGKICQVTRNPINFQIPSQIGYLKQQNEGAVINEYYILNGRRGSAAILRDPNSNRRMELFTSYPFLVCYSADYLSHPFLPCAGICLEAQFAPDSPNLFSSSPTFLKARDRYHESIELRFSW